MLKSMTAFAAAKGAQHGFSWTWEMRSVNGKGLDLRLRVPDWVEGLEPALRARIGKALGRGNVSVNLRLTRDDGAGALAVNTAQLEDVLTAMAEVDATNPQALAYINRLSDYLFVLARVANDDGAADVKWVPGANR